MQLSKAALMCLETSTILKMDMFFENSKITRKKPKIRRRLTVSPFLLEYRVFRENPEKFFKEVNISLGTFDYILENVRNDLEAIVTPFWVVSPEEKLCVTLGYLAKGMQIKTIAQNLKVDPTLAKKVIFLTMDAITKKLGPAHLRDPSHAEMSVLAKEYYEKWRFPNCVGAFGGKYIRLFNAATGTVQKVIISAVVDANFRFLGVYVISRRDSEYFFIRPMFKITGVQCLPGTETMLPLILIGNEAYPLKSNLMKPYPSRTSAGHKARKAFNERLKQARGTVDGAFEILTEKWKIFMKPFDICLEEVKTVVSVAALLHNITKERDGDSDPHFSKFCNMDNRAFIPDLVKHKSRRNNRSSSIAVSIREQLCEYIWNQHKESLPAVSDHELGTSCLEPMPAESDIKDQESVPIESDNMGNDSAPLDGGDIKNQQSVPISDIMHQQSFSLGDIMGQQPVHIQDDNMSQESAPLHL